MRKQGVVRKAAATKSNSLHHGAVKVAGRASTLKSLQPGKLHVTVARNSGAVKAGMGRNPDVLLRVITGQAPFSTINQLSPLQRSEIVEGGVPARLLTRLATTLQVSQERLYSTIGVSRATANRAIKAECALNAADSEHAMGLARLVGQVEQIVQESGDPEGFDAGKWVADFLDSEQASLGGRRPAELMRNSDGRAVVATLVNQMQSGAYA